MSEDEQKKLTAEMMLEVGEMLTHNLKLFEERLMLFLRAEFMTNNKCNNEHKERDLKFDSIKKFVYVSIVLSIIALCFAMIAMGMKIEEVLIKLLTLGR